MTEPFTALLWVSFGGPNGPDDVMPFLENVLRGKPVPLERKMEVAEHYALFGGVSPINAQNRDLMSRVSVALEEKGIDLPIYFGNRNWTPTLTQAIQAMKDAGVKRALAFFTSAYSSYSGCRQYHENIAAARAEVGEGAPQIEKLRTYYNHPLFFKAQVSALSHTLLRHKVSADQTHLMFTAHSLPLAMAQTCDYEAQLRELATLVAQEVNAPSYELVYQSRSGPPGQPWLEPDVCDALCAYARKGGNHVTLVPIGFVSDHMEVLYDLDIEAKAVAEREGITLLRCPTVGNEPDLVDMVVDLICERLEQRAERPTVGQAGPRPDGCAPGCCAYEPRRPQKSS